MHHVTEPRVIRDEVSLWSFIYDPAKKEGKCGYEYCRKQIDKARDERDISQEAHETLKGKMEKARTDYIIFRKLTDKPEIERG